MIPGFNHNVRYRGRIFHCQTEDSGIQNPHIITHLYVGGNILATKKTSYADIVKADHLEEVVTELMKEQHKEVIKRLVSGVFDTSIAQRGVGAASLNGPAPLNVEEGGQNRASFGMSSGMGTRPKPAAPAADPSVASTKVATLADAKKAAMAPVSAAPVSAAPVSAAPVSAAPVSAAPVSAAPVSAAPVSAAPVSAAPVSAARGPRPSSPVVPPTSMEAPEVVEARELLKAPLKPPPPATGTIFGEDLISEKSLDEVILSYLADETNR